MKLLNYRYWVDGSIVAIEDLYGDDSVTANAEIVVTEVEQEIGSLAGKFVIWRDRDYIWDGLTYRDGCISIYPIGVCHFEEAKQKILELIASGSVCYQFGPDSVKNARRSAH